MISSLEDSLKKIKSDYSEINMESSQLRRKIADLEYENGLLKQQGKSEIIVIDNNDLNRILKNNK